MKRVASAVVLFITMAVTGRAADNVFTTANGHWHDFDAFGLTAGATCRQMEVLRGAMVAAAVGVLRFTEPRAVLRA